MKRKAVAGKGEGRGAGLWTSAKPIHLNSDLKDYTNT